MNMKIAPTIAKKKLNLAISVNPSLSLLKTGYIDIYQFHNPPFCPKPNDGSGLYEDKSSP